MSPQFIPHLKGGAFLVTRGKFFPLEERGRTKEWMNEVSDIIIDFDKMDVIKNREGLSYRYYTVLEKLNERLIPYPRLYDLSD